MARKRNRTTPAHAGNVKQLILGLINAFNDYLTGGSTGLLAGWWTGWLMNYMNRPKLLSKLAPYVKTIRNGGTVAPEVIFDAIFLPLVGEVLGGTPTGPIATWVIGCVKTFRKDPVALKYITVFVNGIAKTAGAPKKAKRVRTRTRTTSAAETLTLG